MNLVYFSTWEYFLFVSYGYCMSAIYVNFLVKVILPYMVTLLNGTPIFEWHGKSCS
jgi:hypothetical protein